MNINDEIMMLKIEINQFYGCTTVSGYQDVINSANLFTRYQSLKKLKIRKEKLKIRKEKLKKINLNNFIKATITN
jgi:hypothetical protein